MIAASASSIVAYTGNEPWVLSVSETSVLSSTSGFSWVLSVLGALSAIISSAFLNKKSFKSSSRLLPV